MLLLLFGCLELNSSLFLSQPLTSAAHEGTMIGLWQNATEREGIDRVNTIMNARSVTEYTAEVETFGTEFVSLESGEQFTVTMPLEVKGGGEFQYDDTKIRSQQLFESKSEKNC